MRKGGQLFFAVILCILYQLRFSLKQTFWCVRKIETSSVFLLSVGSCYCFFFADRQTVTQWQTQEFMQHHCFYWTAVCVHDSHLTTRGRSATVQWTHYYCDHLQNIMLSSHLYQFPSLGLFSIAVNTFIKWKLTVDQCIFFPHVLCRFHTLQKRLTQEVRALTLDHIPLNRFKDVRSDLSCSNAGPGGAGEEHVPAHGAAGGCGAGVPWRSGVHLQASVRPTLALLRLLRGREHGLPAYPRTQHHSAGVAGVAVLIRCTWSEITKGRC